MAARMSDYEHLRAKCLSCNELWEDPDFPAVQSSVFYHQTPPFEFSWKRPKDLFNNPRFVLDHSDVFDVTPGKMGDKWLVSCMGMLFSNKGLFFRVAPANQDFGERYAGIFHFRLWWCGEWVEVLVDDRLPTINGRLAFIQALNTEEFWAALLEKAYAKLHGSYEALKYGSFLDGLADFTGGITESLSLPESGDAYTLMTLLQNCSVITCAHHAPKGSTLELKHGLETGMNYRIYTVEKVHTTEGALYVVLLGRPQMPGQVKAAHVVFDTSKWKTILAHERERLLATPHGFWMLLSELRCTFTHIELAHLDAQISVDEPSFAGKRHWYMNVHQAGWRRGVTAGGCRNNTEFFHVNPQVQITLEEEDTVVISLNQFSIMEPKVIGFSLYTLSKPLNEMASANFFKKQKSAINSQYTNSKQVSNRCKLDAGSYLLLPTTYEPRIEADFSLRVFSCKPLAMRVLDESPQLLRAAVVRAPAPAPGPHRDPPFAHYESLPQGGYWKRSAFIGRLDLLKTIQVAKSERDTAGLRRRLKILKNVKTEQVFLQLADEHRTVDPFQLQELLDACLPNDYIKSCAQIDTCRHIVLTMGNGKGRLPMAQFRDLMCSLKLWQTVFRMHAREKMGVVRAERLRDALRDLGFVVPEHVLSNLVLRYMRKDGMLRFGDFVSAVLHLQRAFDIFRTKDLTKSGSAKLTLSEWLKCSLMA